MEVDLRAQCEELLAAVSTLTCERNMLLSKCDAFTVSESEISELRMKLERLEKDRCDNNSYPSDPQEDVRDNNDPSSRNMHCDTVIDVETTDLKKSLMEAIDKNASLAKQLVQVSSLGDKNATIVMEQEKELERLQAREMELISCMEEAKSALRKELDHEEALRESLTSSHAEEVGRLKIELSAARAEIESQRESIAHFSHDSSGSELKSALSQIQK